MAMTSKTRARRKPSPDIAVMDLVNVFLAWLEGGKDMHARLKDLPSSWKEGPKGQELAKHAELFASLAKVCPSLMIPTKKLTIALLALDRDHGPMNYSSCSSQLWADDLGGRIRCMASKFRDCQEEPARSRIMNRLTTKQQELVQPVLALIDAADGKPMAAAKHPRQPSDSGQGSVWSSIEEKANDFFSMDTESCMKALLAGMVVGNSDTASPCGPGNISRGANR